MSDQEPIELELSEAAPAPAAAKKPEPILLELIEDEPAVIPAEKLPRRPAPLPPARPAAVPPRSAVAPDVRMPPASENGFLQPLLFAGVFVGVFGGCLLAFMAYTSLNGATPVTPQTSRSEPVAVVAIPAPTPTRTEVVPEEPDEPPPPVVQPPKIRPKPNRPNPAPAAAPAPVPADALGALLADLKSDNQHKRNFALTKLAQQKPEAGRRPEVVKALLELASNPDLGSPLATEAALNTWASKENTPALLRLLDSSNDNLRALGINVLGTLKDPRSFGPLAALLRKETDRFRVAAALKKIGSACEGELWVQLTSDSSQVRGAACDILGAIGTLRSHGPLQARLNDGDFFVRVGAQRAIEAIKQR